MSTAARRKVKLRPYAARVEVAQTAVFSVVPVQPNRLRRQTRGHPPRGKRIPALPYGAVWHGYGLSACWRAALPATGR